MRRVLRNVGRALVCLTAMATASFVGFVAYKSARLPQPGEFVASLEAEGTLTLLPEAPEDDARLHVALPAITLEGMPLGDAMAILEKDVGIPFDTNADAILEHQISNDRPIDLSTRDGDDAAAVLDAYCAATGYENNRLAWRLIHGKVWFTARGERFIEDKSEITRIFDVQPVMDALRAQRLPAFWMMKRDPRFAVAEGEDAEADGGQQLVTWRGTDLDADAYDFLLSNLPISMGCWGPRGAQVSLRDDGQLVVEGTVTQVLQVAERLDELARCLATLSPAEPSRAGQ